VNALSPQQLPFSHQQPPPTFQIPHDMVPVQHTQPSSSSDMAFLLIDNVINRE
jgi:hypothetical protein